MEAKLMRAALYGRVSMNNGRQDTENQFGQLRQFAATQGETEDGSPTIVFKGHGNVCRACWGFRKSCSRTGVGRCSEALDSAF